MRAASPRRVLYLSVRLVLVWSVLCAVAIGFGRQAVALALPLFDGAIDRVQDDFVARVELAQDQGVWVLRMQPLLIRAVELNAGLAMPPGTRLRAFVTHVDHTLVPPLLFLMVLLAWPGRRWHELALRLLVAAPVLLLILALSAPILLVGQVQMVFSDLAVLAGSPRREPLLVTLMVFMESGGRWLLPLAGGVLCVALGRWLQQARSKMRPAGAPAGNGTPPAPSQPLG